MKSIIASIAILGLVGMVVGTGVSAGQHEASVAATVTVQNISVSVSDGVVSYGILSVSTTKNTLAGELNDLQTATNDGNINQDFDIKGQNSTSWTLAGVAGADAYVHEFSTNSGSTWTALTTSYSSLATGVAALGTQTFDLQITTPTSSSDYNSQPVNVTILATAS